MPFLVWDSIEASKHTLESEHPLHAFYSFLLKSESSDRVASHSTQFVEVSIYKGGSTAAGVTRECGLNEASLPKRVTPLIRVAKAADAIEERLVLGEGLVHGVCFFELG